MSLRQIGKKNPHFPDGWTETENQARAAARLAGSRYYQSSRPCLNGHIGKRFVQNIACYACHLKRTTRNNQRMRKSAPWFSAYCSTRNHAKRDGIRFEITPAYIKSIYPVDGVCPVLGVELRRNGKVVGPHSPTIDRFTPSDGYVVGNVTIVSHLANLIKTNQTDAKFFDKMADWIEHPSSRTGNCKVPHSWLTSMLYGAHKRAKQTDVECNITTKDIEECWPSNNRCPVYETIFERGKNKAVSSSPSLDRIDPTRGYVKGNIAILSFLANRIKQDQTDPKIFRKLAAWLKQRGGQVAHA